MSQRLLRIVEAVAGAPFHVEDAADHEALVAYRDDGTVLVITDGTLGVDFTRGQAVACLFRSRGAWEDSDDICGYAETHDLSTRGVRAMVGGAVGVPEGP